MTETIRHHDQIKSLDEYEVAVYRCLEIAEELMEIILHGKMTPDHVEKMVEYLNLSRQLIESDLIPGGTRNTKAGRQKMIEAIALAFNNSQVSYHILRGQGKY